MIDLKTNRPSQYAGLYGYNNLEKWVKNQGGLIVDLIKTDHNNKTMSVDYSNGVTVYYDYNQREEVNNCIDNYYHLGYVDDHSVLKEKLEQFVS